MFEEVVYRALLFVLVLHGTQIVIDAVCMLDYICTHKKSI